jgi:hypothetical protein
LNLADDAKDGTVAEGCRLIREEGRMVGASGAAAAQDMQREFGRLGLRQDGRDRHDDVDTGLVPPLLRKQIDVEITAGKVL